MSQGYPNFSAFRSWKWIVGVVYILAAVILFLIGRIGAFEAGVLLGLGIILV